MIDLIFVTLQTILVNNTQACFLNFTVPADMWVNCGATKDFIRFVLLPWEYITGGYFSMILVSLFVCFTYIKYHKMIYPLIVGILFLPITAGLFPNSFLIVSLTIVGLLIGIFLHAMLTNRTKEYNG